MQNAPPQSPQSIVPCPQCGTGVRFRSDPTTDRKSCPHCGYVLPKQIAHFKLLQIIGTGGMGAVYFGLDTSLERNVAVKVMREEFAKNPQSVENFLREARAAASLNHPNVAQIYSFGEQNSRYYLVMELLVNGSLDDRIEKEHRLPELDVLDIGIQVASGLKAAYESGLIHRDIKPGNILFAQDGSCKVVDFGLARFESRVSQEQQEEGIWGTPYYIAPEKVSDNLEDFRSDIYSLGGTLFHALAGRAPFEAGTATEVVLKHLHSPVVSLKAFAPDCTPQTTEVIGRMLKRDPAMRPQSYDELLNDLAYAKRFALQKKPPEKLKVESEFSMSMLIGTLAIMVLSLTVAIWFWFNRAKFLPSAETEGAKPKSAVVASVTNAPSKPKPLVATTPPQPAKPVAPPPPPSYAVQIETAYDQAARSNWAGTLSQLEQVARNISIDHALYPWVKFHVAHAKWMVGSRETEANAELQVLVGSTTAEGFQSPVPSNKYPQFLALILLGKITSEKYEKLSSGLPDWMQAIAHFDLGLLALHQNRFSEAAHEWHEYIQAKKGAEQTWVLAYQSMARDFSNEYEKYRNVEKQVNELQAAGKPLEIQQLLKNHQSAWQTPSIRTQINRLTEENQQAIAKIQREEEKRKAEEAQRLEAENRAKALQLEAENKSIEEMRARTPGLIRSYQFSALLDGWKALEPAIKTEGNRKALQYGMALAEALVDYRQEIANDIAAYPYDQDRMMTLANKKMTGKLYQVKEDKLFFRIEFAPGQYGEINCRWSELTPASALELGDFYLSRSIQSKGARDPGVTRRAISMAVFSREFGLPENYVQKYTSIAVQAGGASKEKIEQLFPNMTQK